MQRDAMQFGFHHVALIVGDYSVSKAFYCDVLGLEILAENYREDRGSWKLDLALACGGQLELFSFPDSPARASRPEACGLRHLAFRVSDLDDAVAALKSRLVRFEPIRIDEYTGRRFTFFQDPDGLPLELYEVPNI
ncbi:VOC family protein [Shimia sp. NS0008-38b]|uniref:SMU1112c/YaeR family gloxylase I-like metalloprotein n=1 Tax=Shimia sp. NS0008-38b TaxID=3127653 RepID=UPI0031091D62